MLAVVTRVLTLLAAGVSYHPISYRFYTHRLPTRDVETFLSTCTPPHHAVAEAAFLSFLSYFSIVFLCSLVDLCIPLHLPLYSGRYSARHTCYALLASAK